MTVTTMAADGAVSSPHSHDGSSVSRVMVTVALALLPGIGAYVVFFGIGVLIQCLLAVATALATESAIMKLRGRDPAASLKDGSALVTGLLFALAVSPFTPWWITALGVIFAVGIAKHAFGGLGLNPFNPAMAGYVFVLLGFPVQMNLWPAAPGLIESAPGAGAYAGAVFLPDYGSVDALSGATPLSRMKTQLGLMEMVSDIRAEPMFGKLGGRGWEWIGLAFLLGGIWLLAARIIDWRIPLSMLGAVFVLAMVFNMYDSDVYASPLFHVCSGGMLLGAFFIATDPVTASTTPLGRLYYGALIGILAYVIRVWGAYPEGIAFAVLIANGAAPLIDRYTRPRVLGEEKR